MCPFHWTVGLPKHLSTVFAARFVDETLVILAFLSADLYVDKFIYTYFGRVRWSSITKNPKHFSNTKYIVVLY